MTTTAPPLNFKQIDSLRRGALLTVGDMAKYLGTTRQTYYAWLAGGVPRSTKAADVRAKVKALVTLVVAKEWPTPDAIAADPKERLPMLLELLNNNE